MMWRILSALGVAFLASFASAEVAGRSVSGKDGFEFIAKFCYDYKDADDPKSPGDAFPVGTMQITVTKPSDASSIKAKTLYVLIYADDDENWPMIYGHSGYLDTCVDKTTGKEVGCGCMARQRYANNIEKPEDPASKPKDPYVIDISTLTSKTTPPISVTGRKRPRFWYVVVASDDCSSLEGMEISGTFLQSSDMYGSWSQQFGVDEMGLNTLYVIFFLYFLVLTGVHLSGVTQHWRASKYVHPVLKIFTICLVLEMLSVILFLIHYGGYTHNGEGVPALARAGEVIDKLSVCFFMMLLMLLARGWTISTEELTGKKLVLGTSFSFLVLMLLMLLYKYAIEDPAAVSPGFFYTLCTYLLMGAWGVFAAFFLVTTFRSWKAEDNEAKSSLYMKMLFLYGPWFAGLPAVNLLALWLKPWVALKIVTGFSLVVTSLAYGIMTFLMWPSRAADYFAISQPSTSSMEHYNQL